MGLFGKEVFILAQIIVVEDDVYMREELIDVLEKRDMTLSLCLTLKMPYHK